MKTELDGARSPVLAQRRLLVPSTLVWVVIVLGGAIRFFRFDALSLWIDEAYSLMFTRMSWFQVLGFEGAYDSHPPLYFATAKLFGLVFPELIAGRLVSVIAGTLTLPVIYLLAKRMTNERIALSATVILAISPVHLWYSQEARMYVPSMLFVALSYWALVEFYFKPGRRWAVLYGISVLLAMYYSYSSFYAFVPQLALLALVFAKHKRSATPLIVALAVAILAYVPWVPQWLASVIDADPGRGTYLGVWPEKVAAHLLGITGVLERQFYSGASLLPWENIPVLYWIIAALVLPTIAIASVKLARTSSLGFVSTMALLATILVVVLTSFVSPGLADRTIIYALLGWSILMGAVFADAKTPKWANIAGVAGFSAVVVISIVSIYLVFSAAEKQEFRQVASDVAAVRPAGKPVLLPRPLNYAIIDAYQPGSLDGVAITTTQGLTSDAVWFAYHDSPKFAGFHQELQTLGYERVVHKSYYVSLYLDLYAKPTTDVSDLEQLIGADTKK